MSLEIGVEVAVIRFLVDFYLVNPRYVRLLKIASFWYILAHWSEMRGDSNDINN